MNESIIFLDFDGCLNSTFFNKNREDKGLQLDIKAVEILNDFVASTNSKVVISSSWRRYHSLDELRKILEEYGFKGEIIDKTEAFPYPSLRGNEIYAWLQANRNGDFKRYVIFDDDSDMLYWQKDNLFLCDNYYGLTPNVTYKAERFLNSLK